MQILPGVQAIMLRYNKQPHTIEPKLYTVALHAKNQGQVVVWNTVIAAYGIDTAYSEALEQLQHQDPELYKQGQQLGGWSLQAHIELTPNKIDELLETAYHQYDDIHAAKQRQEVNDLMQTIVETASRKLLNKYSNRFTTAERSYLEKKIAEYEQQH